MLASEAVVIDLKERKIIRGSEELIKIHTPTLVICAKDDLTTPSYFSEIIARSISHSKILLPEQGGHFLSQTMTEQFNRAVLSFLLEQENV